ncbi:MAG: WD40 repeat domain-containing protein, partial [Thermoplasmata archaeon]|nr:WD40 repeat domain-containing protein [Thermoplasmata archaeon]
MKEKGKIANEGDDEMRKEKRSKTAMKNAEKLIECALKGRDPVAEISSKRYFVGLGKFSLVEVGDSVYIAIARDMDLHVYDGDGTEIFSKEYSEFVRKVSAVEVEGSVYIAVGCEKSINVYDLKGTRIFGKKYSKDVWDVSLVEAGGHVYMVVVVAESSEVKEPVKGKKGKMRIYLYRKMTMYLYNLDDGDGTEIFSKRYSKPVRFLSLVEVGGSVYIAVQVEADKIYVYKKEIYYSFADEVEKIFSKRYSEEVRDVFLVEVGGSVYIAVGDEKSINVYDGEGREIFSSDNFETEYKTEPLSFSLVEAGGSVYIVVRVGWRKIRIYDVKGRKIFSRKYSEDVRDVFLVEVGSSVYIAVECRNKIYVYDGDGRKIFSKEYSEFVRKVSAAEVGGSVYIAVRDGKSINVYDREGREILSKRYSEEVRDVSVEDALDMYLRASVYPRGVSIGGSVYIAVGDEKSINVYDGEGREIFSKEYSGTVRDVFLVEVGDMLYIAVRDGKSINVYDGEGREIFGREYSEVVRDVFLVEVGGSVYIAMVVGKKKIRVYDVKGRKIFSRKYSEDIFYVSFFGVGNRLYIAVYISSFSSSALFVHGLFVGTLSDEDKRFISYYGRMKELGLGDRLEFRSVEGLRYMESEEEKKRWVKGYLNELVEEVKRYLKENPPKITVGVRGEVEVGAWSKCELIVRNSGGVMLRDIKANVIGEGIEVRGISEVDRLDVGEEVVIPFRIKSRELGYIPVEMEISYRNVITEEVVMEKASPEIYVKRVGYGGVR